MSFNSMVKDATGAVSTFWIRLAEQFGQARDESKAGTFTADKLARNLVTTAGDAVDAWLKVMQLPPAPLVPLVSFSDTVAAYGLGLTQRASLWQALPVGAVASATPLGELGGSKSISGVTVTVTDTEVKIDIKAAAVAVGLYQGVAFYTVAGTTQVIAQITAHVRA